MNQRICLQSKHRFFDSPVAFTASASSLGISFAAQLYGKSAGFSPNQYFALLGNPAVTGIELRFFPHYILSTLASNSWPTTLVLDEQPINPSPVVHPLNLTALQGVHGAIIANAFVKYFEETRSLAETKYSRDTQRWPAVWNFGRVIRNALSHNGGIKFNNLSAQSVAWRKLSYSPADNGKVVLYRDVTPVELILLMEDMDAVI